MVPSQYIDQYILAAGVARTITIPTGARIAMFHCTADKFSVSWTGSAAVVPVADVTNGTAPDATPTTRDVSGYSSFSVICAESAMLTIAYYS